MADFINAALVAIALFAIFYAIPTLAALILIGIFYIIITIINR